MKTNQQQRAACRAIVKEVLYWRHHIDSRADKAYLTMAIGELELEARLSKRLKLGMHLLLDAILEIPEQQ